jgi:hypothetical protein
MPMSTTVEQEGSRAGSPRLQVSLANLMILVLAAGVATGLVRGARDTWGTRTVPPLGYNPSVPLERTVGVALEVVAVLLILMLVQAFLGLVPRVRSGAVSRTVFLCAIAWRIAAIAVLVNFVAHEWGVLRIDFTTSLMLSREWPGWREAYSVQEALLPICGLLSMLGLSLGMGAGGILEGPASRRPRPYWLFVPLATLAGLLFLAHPGLRGLIVQLVLIALEAVSNAMHHVLVRTPSLAARLLRAGIDAGVAGMIGMVLALIVARDFEKARRAEPWGTTRRGWLLRWLILLATIGAGVYIAVVTIPAIHPCFSEGLREMVGPAVAFTMFCGFGLFAAGLAARAVAGRPAREGPRRLFGPSALFRLAVFGLLCLSALKYLPASSQFVDGVPPVIGRVIDGVQQGHNWLWSLAPEPVTMMAQQCLEPEVVVWSLFMLGLVLLIGELAIRPASWNDVPFDVLAGSPARALQFLWLSMALTTVCLVAVPVFLVASQALAYIQLRAEDWMTGGWHSVF